MLRAKSPLQRVFDFVDSVVEIARGRSCGLRGFQFRLSGGQPFLKSQYVSVRLGWRFRQGYGGRSLFLHARFVPERGDRGGRLQHTTEVFLVLFGDFDRFEKQFPEPGLHGEFGLDAQVFTLLLPLLVFRNDVVQWVTLVQEVAAIERVALLRNEARVANEPA